MDWSLRSFDTKLEDYEGDNHNKNEGADLNMLVE
jgi:hypothetical protein